MSSLIQKAIELARSGRESTHAPTPSQLVAFSLAMVIENDGSTVEETLQRMQSNQRFDGAFVLVHEKKERGWWVPGGGVDLGESLAEGCIRETLEEAGAKVECIGILRIHYGPRRVDAAFLCRPLEIGRAPLKTIADKESKGARWVTRDEMLAIKRGQFEVEDCKLRGEEPIEFLGRLDSGRIYPMDAFVIRKDVSNGDIAKGGPEMVDPGARAVFSTVVGIRVVMLKDGKVAASKDRRLYSHYPWSSEGMKHPLDMEIAYCVMNLREKYQFPSSAEVESFLMCVNTLYETTSALDVYVKIGLDNVREVSLPPDFTWIDPSDLAHPDDKEATKKALAQRTMHLPHNFLSF